MSIVLKQFVSSTVTPVDDAILYQHFDDRAGILAGCSVAINGTKIHVGAGRGVICGRVFQIVAEDVNAVLGANLLGRLLIRVDTSNVNTPISFVAQAANPLPALTQDDINRGGTVYEMPLATYNVSAASISNIKRVAPVLSPLSDMVDGKAKASGWAANRVMVSNSAQDLTVSTVTTTELSRLSGVTSPVQDQLNALSSGWTANRAMISNSNGNLAVSSVSSTELSRLSGVTSSIQNQINAKADAFTFDSNPTYNSNNAVTSGGVFSAENPAITAVTASRPLALNDVGAFLSCYHANVTLTIPTNASVAFPVGSEILIYRNSIYTVTVAAPSGVTIRSAGGTTITAVYGVACLKKLTEDVWLLFGHIE